ncbi:unnamed protein product [Clonostachys rhizophaga]|uniref:AAA+ ATPase domain-containing protein n=1 Tax=Clonostachys rhizophaga TaxID=160324 RepID=A0A9N9VSV6_9HYPO|nr:unnamed protein product [Clonostachys rhizophaga]
MTTIDSTDGLVETSARNGGQDSSKTDLNGLPGQSQSPIGLIEISSSDDDDSQSEDALPTPPESNDAPSPNLAPSQPKDLEWPTETEEAGNQEAEPAKENHELGLNATDELENKAQVVEGGDNNENENRDGKEEEKEEADGNEGTRNGDGDEEQDSNEEKQEKVQPDGAEEESKESEEGNRENGGESKENEEENRENGGEGKKNEEERKDDNANEEVAEDTAAKELESWARILVEDEDPESMMDDSPSRLEWLRLKREDNQENVHLDKIMSMVGHEKIKAHFLAMKMRMDMAKRWKVDVEEPKADLILYGNDGTGKRRIAQIYAEFLYSIGAIAHRTFERNSGYSLEDNGSKATVTFFDQADKIDRTTEVPAILDIVEKRSDPVVLIFSFTNLSEDSRNALYSTSRCRNRLPDPIVLENYNENEVFQLLKRMAKTRPDFEHVQEEERDAILRFLARRIRQGSEGAMSKKFANIHTLKQELDKMTVRWKRRTLRELAEWSKNYASTQGGEVDEKKIEEQRTKLGGVTLDDAIGPNPPDVRNESKAWKTIQAMVGLKSVKKEIEHLFNLAQFNHKRERQGKPGLPISLNRCFLGEPGVGKTTVARLFASIVKELGLVSKGQMILKTPNDLSGEYIGESEKYTRDALEKAQGNVLIIDDAHMLYRSNGCGRNNSDQYRVGIIDTLVANITPGEDRCVILCGYPQQMEEMILNSNPGLQRRFPMENALRFHNYNDDELCQILDLKLAQDQVVASDHALEVARQVLSRNRTRPRFGNGGDVENLVCRARLRQVERLRALNENYMFEMQENPLGPEDFDPDFDRSTRADKNRDDVFRGMVGFEEIVKQFRGYQKMADGMRLFDVDPRPHIPWAFVFKGPPGTGKTTTARKVGKLFYDMGFLSADEVIVCSVSDLIGEYSGQTGPKVLAQFEQGLGKVLFIDEAYRLQGGCSSFHNEAIGELVDIMTKPRYVGNMVVILAGYGDDMENLLASNQGLRSRFPTHIVFPHMTPGHCLQHLKHTLSKLNITFCDDNIEDSTSAKGDIVAEAFRQLIRTKGWANGRDVETVAKNIIGFVFMKAAEEKASGKPSLSVSFPDLVRFLLEMLRERNNIKGGSPDPPALKDLARRAGLI